MLAYFAADGASLVLQRLRLQAPANVVSAACTCSSVATAPLAVRVIATVLPVVFVVPVVPVVWRLWRRIRTVLPGEQGNILSVGGFLLLPYGALIMTMVRLSCPR